MDFEEELRVFGPVVEECRTLVRAIQALETIEHCGLFQRVAAWLLLNEYRERLTWYMWGEPPEWAVEEIFSACQSVAEDRPAVGRSES